MKYILTLILLLSSQVNASSWFGPSAVTNDTPSSYMGIGADGEVLGFESYFNENFLEVDVYLNFSKKTKYAKYGLKMGSYETGEMYAKPYINVSNNYKDLTYGYKLEIDNNNRHYRRPYVYLEKGSYGVEFAHYDKVPTLSLVIYLGD